MKYEYLLIKKAKFKNRISYSKMFFNTSKEARKEFRKDDVLLKCKIDSVYNNWFGLTVKPKDIIKKYEK